MNYGLSLHTLSFDGYERSYRIYIPRSLSPQDSAAVVVTLHGGDFARAHERTHWHELAEEKGFIVLYPQSLRDGVMWNAWDNLGPEQGRPDDVAFLDHLITQLPLEYPMDPERIYLHGQSMGDMMGMHYAYLHSDHIAAAALCSGPTKTKWWMDSGVPRFSPTGPCPILRLHGEEDCFRASGVSPIEAKLYKQQCHVEQNALPWLEKNGCISLPALISTPEYNAVWYQGKESCDFVSLFIKNGLHHPPQWTERWIWDTFFCAFRLDRGTHRRTVPFAPVPSDTQYLAAAAGASALLLHGQYIPSDFKPAIERDQALYLDAALVPFLRDRLSLPPSPLETILIEESPFVSLSSLLQGSGYTLRTAFGAAYAVPHPMELTFDLAYLLRSLLGVQRALCAQDAFTLEDRIFLQQCLDAGFAPAATAEEKIWQWGHTV